MTMQDTVTIFSWCEICGAEMDDIDGTFGTGHRVNHYGYVCWNCTMKAIENTYSEWWQKGNSLTAPERGRK